MSFTFWLLIGIHIVLCLFLVLLVLIQNDKSGGLAGAFGGAGGASSYGRGAVTFISKLTQGVALLFMVIVVAINIVVSKTDTGSSKSLLKQESQKMESGLGSIVPKAPEVIQIDSTGN